MKASLSIGWTAPRPAAGPPPHYRISPAYPSPRYPERRQIVHRPACALVRGVWETLTPEQVLGTLLAPVRLQPRLCRRCKPLGAAGVDLNERMRDSGWDGDVLNDLRDALGLSGLARLLSGSLGTPVA